MAYNPSISPLVEPENPVTTVQEQKVFGLLKVVHTVGTGSTLSAGTRGTEGSTPVNELLV